jgi:hypothetical protein
MALRPLDFESSASTGSAIRAGQARNLLGNAPLAHLLDLASDLFLQRHELCALHGIHERREIALLGLEDLHPAPLHVDQRREQALDLCRIRRLAAHYGAAEPHARVALLHQKLTPLQFVALRDRHQPSHLHVREADLLSHATREIPSQLLLQASAAGCRVVQLPLRLALRCAPGCSRTLRISRHGDEQD